MAEQLLAVAGRTGSALFSLIGHMARRNRQSLSRQFFGSPGTLKPVEYRGEAAGFGWDPAILVPSYRAYAL